MKHYTQAVDICLNILLWNKLMKSETFGQRLKLLRTTHNMSSGNVALKLNTPVGQYRIMEEGKYLPDYFVIEKLMKLYGCTSDYILFGIMIGLREDLFNELTDFAKASLDIDDLVKYFENKDGAVDRAAIKQIIGKRA